MNKKIIVFASIIILAALAIGLYVVVQQKPRPSTSVETGAHTVTYFCQEGIMKADYSQNQVLLSFKDGRKITLPQTMSASGIRYEQGTTTFLSKGDNAFLTEGDKTTYTNCVAGTQTTSQNTNTYTDAAKTFSFSYPSQFTLSGGDIGYSQDWNVQTTNLGLLLAVVNIPHTLLPQTNFGEAKFTVGTSVEPDAVKNCLKSGYGNMGTSKEVTIGSQKFTRITFTGAGAGNYYDTTSYRTLYNNQCYAVEYTIHSTNIYNYSPDQGIKEFDRAKVAQILEDIAQSFKFL